MLKRLFLWLFVMLFMSVFYVEHAKASPLPGRSLTKRTQAQISTSSVSSPLFWLGAVPCLIATPMLVGAFSHGAVTDNYDPHVGKGLGAIGIFVFTLDILLYTLLALDFRMDFGTAGSIHLVVYSVFLAGFGLSLHNFFRSRKLLDPHDRERTKRKFWKGKRIAENRNDRGSTGLKPFTLFF